MSSEQTTSFSSTGEDVIARTIDIDQVHGRAGDLEDFYEIQRTADEIVAGDFKRIALQFPDELLGDSVPVFRSLKARIGSGREIYVLADTSYGRHADPLEAQHVDADAVVHYGYACLSQTSRLPVIYVFGKKPLDLDHALSSILEIVSNDEEEPSNPSVLLKSDVIYSHLMGDFSAKIQDALRLLNATVTYLPLAPKTLPAKAGDQPNIHDQESYTTILYIGGETLALTNLLMTNGQSRVYRFPVFLRGYSSECSLQVISYDPQTRTAKVESSRSNKMLMRRYAVVQKARDADVFGILVGTLGVGQSSFPSPSIAIQKIDTWLCLASYLPLIKHLRSLLAQHHKKSYTISVGKLNPAKLANFLEIECYVLVACPENSLIDAKEFYQPIATPFELEIALGAGRSWTGKYVLDFGQILKESQAVNSSEKGTEKSDNDEKEDTDQPVFSLVTGKYRQAKRYDTEEKSNGVEADSTSLVVRNQEDAVSIALPNSAAAQFLHQRTYRGLETRLGEDEPGVLEQGRSGIAREYQTDRV
ncbi:hypothetical protein H1R20_g13314, partial [Candolleomyces eurysporus]